MLLVQLLLGYLPRQMSAWEQELHRKRTEYARFCEVLCTHRRCMCKWSTLNALHHGALPTSSVGCLQDLIVNVDALRDSDKANDRAEVTEHDL